MYHLFQVLDSLEGSEELVISTGKAYIIAALLEFLGIENLEDTPKHFNVEDEDPDVFFNDVFGKFVEKFVMQWRVPGNWEEDGKLSYGLFSIYTTVLLLQMKDTAREGDGNRNLINQKLLVSVFKSSSAYSKIVLEMFISIAQVECLLPPQLASRMKWGYFVNWKGGKGKNIESDCAQEVSNRLSKKIVQRMGANKTVDNIRKVTKAVNGIKEVVDNYDATTGHKKGSSKHAIRSSSEDELGMINDLIAIRPFKFQPGRFHPSFQGLKRTPSRYMKPNDFYSWIAKQKSHFTTFSPDN